MCYNTALGGVFLMALENYSKEAIVAVHYQALDHLFMASDMRKNLENVLRFEDCMHQSVLSPYEVYAYLRCMEGLGAFYPRVVDLSLIHISEPTRLL